MKPYPFYELNHFTVPRAIIQYPIADPYYYSERGSVANPLIGLCTCVIEDPRSAMPRASPTG